MKLSICIRRKLKSQAGASITFALLLFLVCTVVASVVLTAGTAASGRLSKMAEMDQRYYSVSSAVELLQKQFTGMTITKTTTTITRVHNTCNNAGSVTGSEPAEDSPSVTTQTTVTKNGEAAGPDPEAGISAPLAEDAALQYEIMHTPGADGSSPPSSFSRTLNLTASDSVGTAEAALAVTIQETIDQNGNIVLLVSNTPEAEGGDVFTMKLTFSADIRTTESRQSVNSSPWGINESAGTYRITVTTTETSTTRAGWILTGIETVSQDTGEEGSGG